MKWLELTPDYECNLRCVGCFSVGSAGSMSSRDLLAELRWGRAQGLSWLWIGGGEPTLRKDLLPLIGAARALGYTRIKIQTNGMMFAYPEFLQRCVRAGLSEINFAIKGKNAESHDRQSQREGSYALLLKAIANANAHNLPLTGDVLVYRSTLGELPDLIEHFHSLGVERFNLWMFSTSDQGESDLRQEMPKMSDLVEQIRQTLSRKPDAPPGFLTSLHTPPCVLGPNLSQTAFSAKQLGLLVVNPGGHRFMLEKSPIEGGAFLPRCGQCAVRDLCNGPRADYLQLYGDEEIQPLSMEDGFEWPPDGDS